MISVKLPFLAEDHAEYEALLKKGFPNATQDAVNAQIKALVDSKTILANAICHLSFYYVIGDKDIVSQLTQDKSRFWLYSLESLFNSGVMFLCGLLDDGKDLGYKNLRTIENCFPMLKSQDTQPYKLPKQAEDIYKRLESLRNKRLAHYEYDAVIEKQYYDDPAALCNLIYKYLQKNEHLLFNAEIDTGSLSSHIRQKASGICHDIGVNPLARNDLDELVEYIDELGDDK